MARSPFWHVPGYYGQGDAVQVVGSVAAPLLAGFGVAMIGLVLTAPSGVLRWPNAAIDVLAVSVGLLLFCVQFTLRARQRWSTLSEILGWWDDAATDERRQQLRAEQHADMAEFKRWAARVRWSYHFGIVGLYLGMATLLAWRRLLHASVATTSWP